MTRLGTYAERAADRAVARRQALTAVRVAVFSRGHVAASRHQPLPDAESVYCSVCRLAFDDPRHQRRRPWRRKARRADVAAERSTP